MVARSIVPSLSRLAVKIWSRSRSPPKTWRQNFRMLSISGCATIQTLLIAGSRSGRGVVAPALSLSFSRSDELPYLLHYLLVGYLLFAALVHDLHDPRDDLPRGRELSRARQVSSPSDGLRRAPLLLRRRLG